MDKLDNSGAGYGKQTWKRDNALQNWVVVFTPIDSSLFSVPRERESECERKKNTAIAFYFSFHFNIVTSLYLKTFHVTVARGS